MSYRFVVCVDVEAETLDEAYRRLIKAMGYAEEGHAYMQWESSDEAFTPDGCEIHENDLSEARMRVLDAMHGGEK
jgi:hypothetical protein